MQNETQTADPAGYKWDDECKMPRATNGAYDPLTGAVKPDAPVHVLPTPQALGPTEQAAEDFRQEKYYGACQETQRAAAVARFNSLELLIYQNTIAQLRRPRLTEAQRAQAWRRNAPRPVARKAA